MRIRIRNNTPTARRDASTLIVKLASTLVGIPDGSIGLEKLDEDVIAAIEAVPSHNDTSGRSAADAHPTSAITGLDASLAAKASAAALTTHTSDTANPHATTAAQVGADPAGTATAAVATHAAIATAHGDFLPRAGGTITGNVTTDVGVTIDGRDLSVDGAKLDGIEALADVTDAANVAAAGAIMDSDFAGGAPGSMMRTGIGTYEVLRHQRDGSTWPTPSNDETQGYGYGSEWYIPTKKCLLKCSNPATGNAKWDLIAWDGVNLIDARIGTFARAGEGSGIVGVAPAGDSQPPFLSFFGANVMRVEDRQDGRGPTLLIERPRTNSLIRSEEFDNATWTKVGGLTVSANQMNAPDGGYTDADAIIFTASASDEINQTYSSSNGQNTVNTLWLRTASGTKDLRLGIRQRDGATYAFTNITVTTTWQRFEYNAGVGTGGSSNLFVLRNDVAGTAGTVYAWGAQAEVGTDGSGGTITYPSSSNRTTTGTNTRPGDARNILAGQYPASFGDVGFEIDFCIIPSSSEMVASGQGMSVVAFGTSTGISRFMLTFSGATPQFWIYAPVVHAGGTARGPLSWNRETWVNAKIRPRAGTITLTGLLSGDGIYTITPWQWETSGPLYLSSEGGLVNSLRYFPIIRRLAA